MQDSLWAALVDSHSGLTMALTAENLAERYGISRQAQDEFALLSQQRAAGRAARRAAWPRRSSPTPGHGKRGEAVDVTRTSTRAPKSPWRAWPASRRASRRAARSRPATPAASTTRRRRWSLSSSQFAEARGLASARPPGLLGRRRRGPERSWASAPRRPSAPRSKRADLTLGRDGPDRGQRGVRRAVPGRGARNSAWTAKGST